MIETHLLTLLIFSPLLALLPLILFPSSQERTMKGAVLALSLIPLGLGVTLFVRYYGTGGFEFQEIIPWFQGYQIYYRLGVDGFSMPLMVLTSLLVPLVILSSWTSVHQQLRGYLALFIFLEVGMMGVFASLDLFLFYVFWEAQLIPMYFLIGKWGGERRIYASIKFVLYTMVGSLLMLAAIMYLYYAGGKSLSFEDLLSLNLPLNTQYVLFSAFALAFAIKVPLFPFHTWLPDAHVEAPTGGSVILAGILLKMGTYGLVRFAFTLFPRAAVDFIPLLQILAVIGIVYGSLVAMVQPDIKKLVAYTSVAHLGFVVLGFCSLTHQGVAGANLQSLNHGISTGALFFLVGMIYERRHTRLISEYGGLASVMPLFAVLFLIVTFSSIALPTTNGFVGEFLILLGSYKSQPLFTAIAASGVILGAVAMLWMVKRVFFGAVTSEKNKALLDLNPREITVMVPLIILIFVIGLAPGLILKKTELTVTKFVQRFQALENQ
ncbi:MAG: NADH-quinone oxidoreductase subunit M [Deltaproteobacteria bacterium]|nr:MAG: NADH-quinone oxidoreductase subunit M [Deltaproteobacteria bacterium]